MCNHWACLSRIEGTHQKVKTAKESLHVLKLWECWCISAWSLYLSIAKNVLIKCLQNKIKGIFVFLGLLETWIKFKLNCLNTPQTCCLSPHPAERCTFLQFSLSSCSHILPEKSTERERDKKSKKERIILTIFSVRLAPGKLDWMGWKTSYINPIRFWSVAVIGQHRQRRRALCTVQ